MKLYKALTNIIVPIGFQIGLSKKQMHDRTHNVHVHGKEDGRTIVEGVHELHFKAGETLSMANNTASLFERSAGSIAELGGEDTDIIEEQRLQAAADEAQQQLAEEAQHV